MIGKFVGGDKADKGDREIREIRGTGDKGGSGVSFPYLPHCTGCCQELKMFGEGRSVKIARAFAAWQLKIISLERIGAASGTPTPLSPRFFHSLLKHLVLLSIPDRF